MTKKILILLVISIFFLMNTPHVFADIGAGMGCNPNGEKCIDGYSCQPDRARPTTFSCQPDTVSGIFGKIQPPAAIRSLLQGDPTGAAGISQFLSNLIVLIYSIAGIVLILMLLWGAFDWLISEGDKERLSAAQNKIIAAIIGIILFAVAFAIIQVLGNFTGFTFFVG